MMIYEDVFRKFQAEGIEYIIVGGIAANLLGLIRATADLDIIININGENIARADKALKFLKYKVRQPIDVQGLAEKSIAILKKTKNLKALSYYKSGELSEVDIIIDSPVSFEQAKKRCKTILVGGMKLPVISIDDLIRMKSVTGRAVDKYDIKQLKKVKKIKL